MFPFVFSFRRAEGYGGRGWNRISEGQVFMKNELAQVNELRHITDEKNNIRETIRLLTESQTRIALRLYYSGTFFRPGRKDSLSDPFYQEREGQVYARQFRVCFKKRGCVPDPSR